MALTVRPATLQDVTALTALVNAIIAKGGTTAHQTPFTEAEFTDHYLTGPDVITCHAAFSHDRPVGFQVLGFWPGLPVRWGDIGTFVSESARGTGAGRALFHATAAAARGRGLLAINATIRADNAQGLGYYSRIGFVDYAAEPDWALDDGRRVGRISKRCDLA